MGTDLTLLTIAYADDTGVHCDACFKLDRDPDLFYDIAFHILEKGSVDKIIFPGSQKKVKLDLYGHKIQSVCAKDLIELKLYNSSKFNKATWKFLKGLNKDTRVVLWWT